MAVNRGDNRGERSVAEKIAFVAIFQNLRNRGGGIFGRPILSQISKVIFRKTCHIPRGLSNYRGGKTYYNILTGVDMGIK